MTLRTNLSTGPVEVSVEVINALAAPPFSHRSPGFKDLYKKTTEILCNEFCVKETFILTGSGTMANECMLQEIKALGSTGLILSNGEFGARLMNQARRNNISFLSFELDWGERFNLTDISSLVRLHSIHWILFCHCETSTGVVNDLGALASVCTENKCACFVDCMSTVGTAPLDLSSVTMATASSGKGLASIPGLAIVFCNMQPLIKTNSPVFLDLANYKNCDGIPFTLSSNLLQALFTAISQKLTKEQFEHSRLIAEKIYASLAEKNLLPFATKDSRVFTITPHSKNDTDRMHLLSRQLITSSESDYLRRRGWQQLAVFGCYNARQVHEVGHALRTADTGTYNHYACSPQIK